MSVRGRGCRPNEGGQASYRRRRHVTELIGLVLDFVRSILGGTRGI